MGHFLDSSVISHAGRSFAPLRITETKKPGSQSKLNFRVFHSFHRSKSMVGMGGLEPPTSRLSVVRFINFIFFQLSQKALNRRVSDVFNKASIKNIIQRKSQRIVQSSITATRNRSLSMKSSKFRYFLKSCWINLESDTIVSGNWLLWK